MILPKGSSIGLRPQSQIDTTTSDGNQPSGESNSLIQPYTINNGQCINLSPIQIAPQHPAIISSPICFPQNLALGGSKYTSSFLPTHPVLSMGANTGANTLNNISHQYIGNASSAQLPGNTQISQAPIFIAVPVMGSSPIMYPTTNAPPPFNTMFATNKMPFLSQGNIAFVPPTLKPDTSSGCINATFDKVSEETSPQNIYATIPQPQVIPFGQPLQIIQTMPVQQPNASNMHFLNFVSQR